MTRLLLVNVLATAVGAGFLPWLGFARSRRELLRRLPAAPLLGFAVVGLVAATMALVHVSLGLAGLAGLAVAAAATGFRRLRDDEYVPRSPRRRVDSIAAVAAGAAIVATFVHAAAAFRVKPLVDYDGWTIWAMKAKALATLGWADPAVFASDAYEHAHLEYPLLLPAFEALLIPSSGAFDGRVLVFQFLLLAVAGIGCLWTLLEDRVRPAILWPALAAIATAPSLLGQSLTAYADVPLALVVAAGLVAAARWVEAGEPAYLVTATVFFAAAVNLKNEGLAFVGAAYVALVLVARGRRRAAVLSATAVVVALLPWRVFVAVHGLHGEDYDLSASFDAAWVLGRAGRGPIALQRLLELGFAPDRWALLAPLAVVGLAIAFVAGRWREAVFGVVFAGASLLALSWIYLISPLGIGDYLNASADRIVSSVVVATAALAPLLVADGVRREAGAGK